MSAMWHLGVDRHVVGPAFADMRTASTTARLRSHDLTTFDISAEAIVSQSTIDPPVLGPA